MKKNNLKILILEDNPYDAELNISELKKEKRIFDTRIVSDREGFIRELDQYNPDIILSDYNLPRFNGLDALHLAKEKKPLIPFIIVTGSLDEETAVDCIKQGAWDYVLKEHLVRLNPAVKYALQYSQEIEQRKHAELRIRESEKLSRKLLDNIETGVFLTGLDATIIHCNQKAEKLIGRALETIRGKKFFEALDFFDENGQRLADSRKTCFEKVIISREGQSGVNIMLQKPDGEEAWFDACVTPVLEDSGKFSQLIFCISDITEKVRMHIHLRESQSKYEAVFNSVNDGIFLHDIKDFSILDVNDRVVEMYGWRKEEIRKLSVGDLSDVEGGYTTGMASSYVKLAAGGKTQAKEWLAKHKSGKIFWVHVTLQRVKLGSGQFVMALVKDIDKQKKAEMSLHESEEQYRVLSQNTPDAVMRYDRELRHIFVNESVAVLFGTEPEKFINRSFREMKVLPENFVKTWEDNLRKTFDGRKSCEAEIVTEMNGRLTFIESRLFPEYNETEEVASVIAVVRDITDRKMAESKLRGSEEMLHLVFDNIPHAVFWKDRNSVYLGGNKSFIESAGLEKPGDLTGLTDYDLPWRIESDSFISLDKRVMENDQAEYHIIEERQLADGSISWNDTNKIPIHDDEGKVIGILGTSENITGKKKSQEALRISEERLKMALEASNDGLWDWNRETGEIYFSPRFFTMLGYEPDEFEHNTEALFNLIHPDDIEKVNTYFETLSLSNGILSEVELRVRRKEGNYAWIQSRGKAFKTETKGPATRFVGTHVDITQRKRHENIQEVLFEIANSITTTRNMDELFENIQRSLRRVIDTTNCYVALYNEQNDKITLSFHRDEKDDFQEFPAGKTITAYVIRTGKSQLVSRQRISELESSGEIEPIGAYSVSWLGVPLKSNEKIIGVFVVQSYDEKIQYTQEDVQLLEFVSDQIALAIERKIDQDNIKQNQERLRKIIESSPDGLVVIDLEGAILEHNTSFPGMLQIPAAAIKERNFFEFISVPDIIRAQNSLHNTLKSGYRKNIEFKMRRDDCSEFFAETSFGVIQGAGKGDETIVIVVKNINERKAYEFNLRIAKEKAEESDSLKTAFLSNMSHEIRTPMNAIIGFAELLSNPDITTTEKEEFIQQINNGADSLMRLIDDIIDIAKIEAGQIRINRSFFDLAPVMRDLKMIFSKHMIRHGKERIRLVEDHNNFSSSVQLFTDEFRIRQVFSNLIGNAIKFTEEGEVRYGIKEISNGSIGFYVNDTGIGIDKGKLDVIFERFRQGYENKKKFYGGTGLGLAISKHLVELLGGEIHVESILGGGSVFSFSIPFQKQEIKMPEEWVTIDRSPKNWENKTILVAEDDKANFILLREILKRTRANIVWAKDGDEAIQIFSSCKIDLVLMDVQMPVMDGYEATRVIKELNSKVPVIAQTAYAMAGEREMSLDAGCDDYISKPVRINELMFVLNKYFL